MCQQLPEVRKGSSQGATVVLTEARHRQLLAREKLLAELVVETRKLISEVMDIKDYVDHIEPALKVCNLLVKSNQDILSD